MGIANERGGSDDCCKRVDLARPQTINTGSNPQRDSTVCTLFVQSSGLRRRDAERPLAQTQLIRFQAVDPFPFASWKQLVIWSCGSIAYGWSRGFESHALRQRKIDYRTQFDSLPVDGLGQN